jgi:ComF family protein
MNLYRKIKNVILDTIFPIECVGCHRPKTFLCDTCLLKIPVRIDQMCPLCMKHTTPHGQVCIDRIGQSSLDGLLVASSYKNQLLSKAIHLYKYRFIQDLSQPLSRLLLHAITQSEIPLPDMICPVPLHLWRMRWRGFNQSKLLADRLSENLIPQLPILVSNGLIRDRFTLPQMKIQDIEERRKNILGAFRWLPSSEDISGKYIWLIDDVATTASTLEECAKVLKQNGAKRVFGVVLAR